MTLIMFKSLKIRLEQTLKLTKTTRNRLKIYKCKVIILIKSLKWICYLRTLTLALINQVNKSMDFNDRLQTLTVGKKIKLKCTGKFNNNK